MVKNKFIVFCKNIKMYQIVQFKYKEFIICQFYLTYKKNERGLKKSFLDKIPKWLLS